MNPKQTPPDDDDPDRFIATLVHQLKTPAGAMQASSRNLKRNLAGLLEQVAFLQGLPEGIRRRMEFLARGLGLPAEPPLTGLPPEGRIEAIRGRLAGAGCPGDLDAAATSLLRSGWEPMIEEILPLLKEGDPGLLPLLETAARVRSNLASLDASLSRICSQAEALRGLAAPLQGPGFDPCEAIASAARLVGEGLPDGIRLELRLDPAPRVAGRPDLLHEALCNVLVNAVQAVRGAGRAGRIVVTAGSSDSGGALITVTDDGPGIPPESLGKIFEPSFTTRAASGGTGLGLALARRIVQKLNGTVQAASRPGCTIFRIDLPAAPAAGARTAAGAGGAS